MARPAKLPDRSTSLGAQEDGGELDASGLGSGPAYQLQQRLRERLERGTAISGIGGDLGAGAMPSRILADRIETMASTVSRWSGPVLLVLTLGALLKLII